jgi:hypothetical protein
MTWTAAVMSDDSLDPDSLVGRMLRQSESEYLPNTTEASKALPLWIAMNDADCNASGGYLHAIAAEIEALRDWLLPEQPEPPSSPHMGNWVPSAPPPATARRFNYRAWVLGHVNEIRAAQGRSPVATR